MKSIKLLLIYAITLLLMIFASCNSGSEERVEAQTIQNQNSEISDGITIAGNPTYETVENGNRLTESSLKSQVPETIMGISKSGEVSYKEARSGSGRHATIYQMYYDSQQSSAIYLDVFDYADDPAHIIEMMQRSVGESSNTRQNEEGWIITEESQSSGDRVTIRDLTVENPRFTIKMRSMPGDAPTAPSVETMMAALEQSKLLELFELEIPQGDAETTQMADNKNDLVCDELLPLERVRSYCGIEGVEVNVTSFEQQKNCNRQYSHPDNFGGLTFIVTQYNDSEMAARAVETKLNDDDLDSESISNLGDTASMVTVGEDLFLSVAHNSYLIELRSGEGMGPAKTASVCLDQDKLRILASEVLGQLP